MFVPYSALKTPPPPYQELAVPTNNKSTQFSVTLNASQNPSLIRSPRSPRRIDAAWLTPAAQGPASPGTPRHAAAHTISTTQYVYTGTAHYMQWHITVYAMGQQSISTDSAQYMQWHITIYAISYHSICNITSQYMQYNITVYAMTQHSICNITSQYMQ
jgi:hypothetical protein